MSSSLFVDLRLLGPEMVIVAFLVGLFLVDAFAPSLRKSFLGLIVIGMACAIGIWGTLQMDFGAPIHLFYRSVVDDSFSTFFRLLFFFATFVCAYLSFGSRELDPASRMEFSILLLCVTFGLNLMAITTNLLVLYIGLETVSIISFVMAGMRRQDLKANEASLKYLVYGAMASGVMIYGFSLLYGFTGSLNYEDIGRFLSQNAWAAPYATTLSLFMVYSGLAYKISSFPMHFWTPDVYEGAPTPVVAFFSIGPKAAGFAALTRLLLSAFALPVANGSWRTLGGLDWTSVLAVIAAVTMVVGNFSAVGQTSTKRLFAYSSIAHVGYMMMGLVSANAFGVSSILFYLVAYCLMNIGAFWVVSVVSDMKGSDDLSAFKGLGWTCPLLGTCMAVFLFSLTGIPLFSGFIGKFLLFANVINTPGFLWLAIVGVLNSVVSLYYYAKILKAVWLDRPDGDLAYRLPLYHAIGLLGLAIPTVVLGLYFAPLLRFTESTLANFR